MFNENEVVSRIIEGDLRAFEQLVKQYQKLVFHVITRMMADTEDAKDICQEVFIKVYTNLKSFGFQSKLSTWIARIAYHTAINYLKKHKKITNVQYPDDLDQFHFTDENPEKTLIKKDLSAYINQLIEKMPVQYKTMLTLYHLNEFSYQEIEEITGMPEGTVKSYLYRARRLLKDKLEVYLKNEIL